MDSVFSNTLAAILTIGIISFLYKDNPLYKFCESLFIGVSAGYWFVQQYYANLLPKLFDNLGITRLLGAENVADGALQNLFVRGQWDENLLYLIAGILGVMMLLRLIPKIGWMARWPMAFIVGSIAGLYYGVHCRLHRGTLLHHLLPVQRHEADAKHNPAFNLLQ